MRELSLAARIMTALLALTCPRDAAAHAPGTLNDIQTASYRLSFSNALVSVREDYRLTKWPMARRTFLLRAASGRVVSLPIADGGAGSLTGLGLYKRVDPQFDNRGVATDGDYVLLGARVCVAFDPIRATAKRCAVRPPCKGNQPMGLVYIGAFTWANGYDPPHGRFGYGWRFLSAEEGGGGGFCPEGG